MTACVCELSGLCVSIIKSLQAECRVFFALPRLCTTQVFGAPFHKGAKMAEKVSSHAHKSKECYIQCLLLASLQMGSMLPLDTQRGVQFRCSMPACDGQWTGNAIIL